MSQNPEVNQFDSRLNAAREARLPMERLWLENMAFYMGKQWYQWDEVLRILKRPKVPRWRVLMVVNMVQTYIWTEYAKMTQQPPTALVSPVEDNTGEIQKAKTAQKVLTYLDEVTDLEDMSRRALIWSLVTGTGLMKARWDTSVGDVIDDRGTHMGEIAVDFVSPFEIYPDPFGERMKDKNWLIQVKLRSVEYVRDKYGVKMEPTQYSLNEFVDGQLSVITDQYTNQMREGVLTKEYWEVPSDTTPDGKLVVYAGDTILRDDPNPYPDIGLPYVSIPNILVPGRFWGDSKVTQLIDVQRNYNKSRSQLIEARNNLARGKWLIPDGSLPPGKKITSAPGEMITYTPIQGEKPEMVPGIAVSESFWKDLEQTRQEFMDIFGQHEVSQAQVPGEVKSGVAIARLQEQDDERVGPSSRLFEEAIEDLYTMELKLAKRFYTENRTGRIIGKGNRVETFMFYKDTLPDHVDVKVETGSSLPRSRVAKQQFLLELYDRKLFSDQRRFLELMDMGDVEGMYDEVEMDSAQAERENLTMKTSGQIATVEDFHNHGQHAYLHNAFRKGEEYDNLDQNIKNVFKQHVITHQEYLAQEAQQQAVAAAQAKLKIVEQGQVTPEQTAQVLGLPQPQQPGQQQGTGAAPPSPNGGPRQVPQRQSAPQMNSEGGGRLA